MKTYVVGVLDFFENNNKIVKVEAKNKPEAIGEAVAKFYKENGNYDENVKEGLDETLANLNTTNELISEFSNWELAVSEPMEI